MVGVRLAMWVWWYRLPSQWCRHYTKPNATNRYCRRRSRRGGGRYCCGGGDGAEQVSDSWSQDCVNWGRIGYSFWAAIRGETLNRWQVQSFSFPIVRYCFFSRLDWCYFQTTAYTLSVYFKLESKFSDIILRNRTMIAITVCPLHEHNNICSLLLNKHLVFIENNKVAVVEWVGGPTKQKFPVRLTLDYVSLILIGCENRVDFEYVNEHSDVSANDWECALQKRISISCFLPTNVWRLFKDDWVSQYRGPSTRYSVFE